MKDNCLCSSSWLSLCKATALVVGRVLSRTSMTLGFKEQGNGDAQDYWAWPCVATELCGIEGHKDLFSLDVLRMVLMHQIC